MWYDLYDESHMPSFSDIKSYIKSDNWDKLLIHIESTYNVLPEVSYSKCSAKKGWNIKYKKGSKSICTLYPDDGYYAVLVILGKNEEARAEEAIRTCTEKVQDIYYSVSALNGSKWLMIEVKNKKELSDVIKLIDIRATK